MTNLISACIAFLVANLFISLFFIVLFYRFNYSYDLVSENKKLEKEIEFNKQILSRLKRSINNELDKVGKK